MNCKTITERLKRVATIVDSWKGENGVPQIERDIALGELRTIYDALLVVEADSDEGEVEVADVEAREEVIEAREQMPEAEAVVPEVAFVETFYDALDIDALLGLNDEPSKEQPAVTEEIVDVETTEEVVGEASESSEESAESLDNSENSEEDAETTTEPVAEPLVEPVAESIIEPVVVEPTPEPLVEPVAVPTPEPVVEEPKSVGAGLFDLSDIPVRSKSRRKMISLYSDNPLPVQTYAEPQKAEPKAVESAPVAETVTKVEAPSVADVVASHSQQRLGDSFGEVKTLADKMAKEDIATTPFNRITALRQAIGLNDKFLMIRDLFGGDAERYEATIDTLDEFEDLDECIIYIVENFRWNPDLEAAKLLVSLIERKLA
ncbi:MAG: hypothetical protein J6V55_01900 [Alistipes sp.]|nr:hypothetical protein [Alistipes sp.]